MAGVVEGLLPQAKCDKAKRPQAPKSKRQINLFMRHLPKCVFLVLFINRFAAEKSYRENVFLIFSYQNDSERKSPKSFPSPLMFPIEGSILILTKKNKKVGAYDPEKIDALYFDR